MRRCERVLDMIHEDGDDPLLLLWRIAQSEDVSVSERITAAKEVASYLHVKQSSVKVSGGDAPIKFHVSWDQPDDGAPVIEITGERVDDMESCYDPDNS